MSVRQKSETRLVIICINPNTSCPNQFNYSYIILIKNFKEKNITFNQIKYTKFMETKLKSEVHLGGLPIRFVIYLKKEI